MNVQSLHMIEREGIKLMNYHTHDQASEQQLVAPHFAPGSPVGAPLTAWEPLESSVQFWAQLAQEVTHPKALQGIGAVFLAFGFERSAHANYTYAWRTLWSTSSEVVMQTLEQTTRDLEEAYENWQSVGLTLDTFAREEGITEDDMEIARSQIVHHSQRISLLKQSVYVERQRRQQHRFVQVIGMREQVEMPDSEEEGDR
jgi:hypothetical protein